MRTPTKSRLRQFSDTVSELEVEGAFRTLSEARKLEQEGHSIIHLEIGEPDFPTPDAIAARGVQAIREGQTRYTPAAGLPLLREQIAEKVSQDRGVMVSSDEVVVGPGAKPLLLLPTLTVVGEGDEVIYPNPGFPTYEAMIRIAGGEPVPAPVSDANHFQLQPDRLEECITEDTRMIVINSPSNPTGAVLSERELKSIASVAIKHDLWVMSDEIYRQMTFPPRQHLSLLSFDGMKERTIVVDGFSKSNAMTGWRLGYGVMPQQLAEKVSLLLVHSIGCTAEFTQLAGIKALEMGEESSIAMRDAYQARRDLLVKRLNEIPEFECEMPDGAFYAFPDISRMGRSSQSVADALLHEAGVAVLPGTAFGQKGEGFLRLCYANSIENLNLAMDRISHWVQCQTKD